MGNHTNYSKADLNELIELANEIDDETERFQKIRKKKHFDDGTTIKGNKKKKNKVKRGGKDIIEELL